MSFQVPSLTLQLHNSVPLTDFRVPEGAQVIAVALAKIPFTPLVVNRPLDDLKAKVFACSQASAPFPQNLQALLSVRNKPLDDLKEKASITPQVEASFPKELQPLVPIVRAALPALAGEFPFWLLWAYAVKQRLQTYAPNEITEVRDIVWYKFYLDPSDLDCVVPGFEISKDVDLINGKNEQFTGRISKLLKILQAKHGTKNSLHFLELLQLIEQAPRALFCNANLDASQEGSKKDYETQLTALAEFTTYIFPQYGINWDNGRRMSLEVRLQFPHNWDTFSEERKLFKSVQAAARLVAGGFHYAFARTLHFTDNDKANVLMASIIDSQFLGMRRMVLLLKTCCQLRESQQLHFWTPERRAKEAEIRLAVVRLVEEMLPREKLKQGVPKFADPLLVAVLQTPVLAFLGKHFYKLEEFAKQAFDLTQELEAGEEAFFSRIYVWLHVPVLKAVIPELLEWHFSKKMNGLSSVLNNLHQTRKELFIWLESVLKQQPTPFLKENREPILKAIRLFHQRYCLPVVKKFQMLFHLTHLNGDERFVFSEENFLDELQKGSVFEPLADYLYLAGLEKVFERVVESIPKAAYVPPPAPKPAALEPAVSHQKPKVAPQAVHAPHPVKKEKLAKKQVVPSGAAAKQPELPLKASEMVANVDITHFHASLTDRRKMVAFLKEAHVDFSEGGSHTRLRGLPALPRHGTLSLGVVRAITTAMAARDAGAAAGAGAGADSATAKLKK